MEVSDIACARLNRFCGIIARQHNTGGVQVDADVRMAHTAYYLADLLPMCQEIALIHGRIRLDVTSYVPRLTDVTNAAEEVFRDCHRLAVLDGAASAVLGRTEYHPTASKTRCQFRDASEMCNRCVLNLARSEHL